MPIDLRAGVILSSSIVVLLEGSTKRDIEKSEAQELIGDMPQVSLSANGGVVLSSFRKQLEVVLRQNRLDIVDRSGKEPGLLSLGGIVIGFMKLLGGTPKSMGFNFEVELPIEEESTAGQQLAGFLTFSDVGEGLLIVGNAVSFSFSKGDWLYTARIQPRWGDPNASQLSVAINVHKDFASDEEGKEGSDRGDEELDRQLAGAYNDCVEALLRLPA